MKTSFLTPLNLRQIDSSTFAFNVWQTFWDQTWPIWNGSTQTFLITDCFVYYNKDSFPGQKDTFDLLLSRCGWIGSVCLEVMKVLVHTQNLLFTKVKLYYFSKYMPNTFNFQRWIYGGFGWLYKQQLLFLFTWNIVKNPTSQSQRFMVVFKGQTQHFKCYQEIHWDIKQQISFDPCHTFGLVNC